MNHQNLKIILLGAAMDKAGMKTRDIRFFSNKNDQIICIHSKWARDYAKYLEQQPWVQSYQAVVPLEPDYIQHVSPVDIRSLYFNPKVFCTMYNIYTYIQLSSIITDFNWFFPFNICYISKNTPFFDFFS